MLLFHSMRPSPKKPQQQTNQKNKNKSPLVTSGNQVLHHSHSSSVHTDTASEV